MGDETSRNGSIANLAPGDLHVLADVLAVLVPADVAVPADWAAGWQACVTAIRVVAETSRNPEPGEAASRRLREPQAAGRAVSDEGCEPLAPCPRPTCPSTLLPHPGGPYCGWCGWNA